jgi:hypothetical protein
VRIGSGVSTAKRRDETRREATGVRSISRAIAAARPHNLTSRVSAERTRRSSIFALASASSRAIASCTRCSASMSFASTVGVTTFLMRDCGVS